MKNFTAALTLLFALTTSAFADPSSSKLVFGGVNLGMTAFPGHDGYQVTWGARFGVNAINTPIGVIAPVFIRQETGMIQLVGDTTLIEYNAQLLLRRIMDTGFYAGPQIGLSQTTQTYSTLPTEVTNRFVYGLAGGYEFFSDHLFSFGPEVQLLRMSGMNEVRGLVNLTLSF